MSSIPIDQGGARAQPYGPGPPLQPPPGFTIDQALLDAENVGQPFPTITNTQTPKPKPTDFGDFIVGFVAEVLSNLPFPFNAITVAFPAIRDWVTGALQTVADFAESIAAAVLDFVWYDLLNPVLNFVANSVRGLWSFLYDLLGQLASDVANVVDFIAGIGNWLLNQLAGLADFLWNLVSPFVGWFVDNILAPLWDQITSFVNDLLQAVASVGGWLWDLIQQIAGFVFDELIKPVYQFILDAINTALDGLGIAWDVLQEAWGWIVYFATHPFTWFSDLFGGWFDHGSSWLLNLVTSTIASDGDSIEQFVAGYFK